MATFGTTVVNSHVTDLKDMTLKELIEYSQITSAGNINWDIAMHEFMAVNIVRMEQALKNFTLTNYPLDYANLILIPNSFRDLSFMGLESSKVFKDIYGTGVNSIYQSNIYQFIIVAKNCP